MPDLLTLIAFGLFLLVAAYRGWRAKGYGLIAILVVASYVVLVGYLYWDRCAARRDVAELTPDRVVQMELEGRRLNRAEDVAAVLRSIQDAQFSFNRRALSREVPLALTLTDGSVRRYGVARALNESGARIRDPRRSAYSFSPTLPQLLSRAGAPLP
jgi:hypothetical protein